MGTVSSPEDKVSRMLRVRVRVSSSRRVPVTPPVTAAKMLRSLQPLTGPEQGSAAVPKQVWPLDNMPGTMDEYQAQQLLQHLSQETKYLTLVAHGDKETQATGLQHSSPGTCRAILAVQLTSSRPLRPGHHPLALLRLFLPIQVGQAQVADLHLFHCGCQCHQPSLGSL